MSAPLHFSIGQRAYEWRERGVTFGRPLAVDDNTLCAYDQRERLIKTFPRTNRKEITRHKAYGHTTNRKPARHCHPSLKERLAVACVPRSRRLIVATLTPEQRQLVLGKPASGTDPGQVLPERQHAHDHTLG